MIRYEFKSEGSYAVKNIAKADPQKIGEELDKITDAHGGRLTADDVVEAAENRRSPLHRHFEWDDAKAAHAHRLDQARELIRIVRIVEPEAPQGLTRAYLSITDRGGASYRKISEIRSSADLQATVMRQADRDLAAWETRYRDLTDICEVIVEARKKLASKLESAQSATQ